MQASESALASADALSAKPAFCESIERSDNPTAVSKSNPPTITTEVSAIYPWSNANFWVVIDQKDVIRTVAAEAIVREKSYDRRPRGFEVSTRSEILIDAGRAIGPDRATEKLFTTTLAAVKRIGVAVAS